MMESLGGGLKVNIYVRLNMHHVISYFGARYYDATLSVWLSVDPLSDKHPSMSAFMYCAGNPVMLVDPDGMEIDISELYRKNKDGEYVHTTQIEAFEAFAKSEEGQSELAKYAKKGQTIAGIMFEEDGQYHKKNIDLSFTGSTDITKTDNRSGETGASIVDGRLKITVRAIGQSDISSGIITVIHEVYIHGSQYSRDFIDNKKLDNSHAYKELREFAEERGYGTSYIHHWQEINVDKHMEKYGLPIMRTYFESVGIRKTDNQIRNMMKFVP